MLERIDLDSVELDRVELSDGPVSPLEGLESTGDIEQDCGQELGVVLSEFQRRKQNEDKRFTKATDSEYWVCLCFQTREQVEEFMTSCGHPQPREKYVDGVKFAKRIGKPVTPDTTPFGTVKIDQKWSKLAMEV